MTCLPRPHSTDTLNNERPSPFLRIQRNAHSHWKRKWWRMKEAIIEYGAVGRKNITEVRITFRISWKNPLPKEEYLPSSPQAGRWNERELRWYLARYAPGRSSHYNGAGTGHWDLWDGDRHETMVLAFQDRSAASDHEERPDFPRTPPTIDQARRVAAEQRISKRLPNLEHMHGRFNTVPAAAVLVELKQFAQWNPIKIWPNNILPTSFIIIWVHTYDLQYITWPYEWLISLHRGVRMIVNHCSRTEDCCEMACPLQSPSITGKVEYVKGPPAGELETSKFLRSQRNSSTQLMAR